MRWAVAVIVLAASAATAQPQSGGVPSEPPSAPPSNASGSASDAGNGASGSASDGSASDAAPSTNEPSVPATEHSAPAAAFAPQSTEPEPLFPACLPFYTEGHLLVGGRSGPANVPEVVIMRWSLGFRVCTKVEISAGLVLDRGLDTNVAHPRYHGNGAEARVMFPLPNHLRIGPHFAIVNSTTSTGSNAAIWIGARLERDPIVIGLDVLRMPDTTLEAPYDVWGFYGSLGMRGWPGLIGFAAVSVLYIGNIVINEHGS